VGSPVRLPGVVIPRSYKAFSKLFGDCQAMWFADDLLQAFGESGV